MRLFAGHLSLLFLCCSVAHAQGGAPNIYPRDLYAGENVVTISHERGIDRIRFTSSANTRVEIPSIRGCPKQVDVRVFIDNPTTSEFVQFLVHDCTGAFTAQTVNAENWEIRHERLRVEVGKDSCIPALVGTSGRKDIDSMVADDPRIRIELPRKRGETWVSTQEDTLRYRIFVARKHYYFYSLGMQLVTTLSEQLDGTVELKNGCGTTFEISFPENNRTKL